MILKRLVGHKTNQSNPANHNKINSLTNYKKCWFFYFQRIQQHWLMLFNPVKTKFSTNT
jgi:hypothetical protein